MSLLGNLPPLHGRRSGKSPSPSSLSPPVSSFGSPSTSPPVSARRVIRPLRLALRFSPPCLALEYQHLPSRQRRYREFSVALSTANAMVQRLHAEHPHHLSADLVLSSQLHSLMVRLLAAQSRPSSSTLALDLNKVEPSVLQAAKEEMSLSFNAKLLRPGDAGYEYDKQVEFEEATEPSDWD